jgi:hypothetical protein
MKSSKLFLVAAVTGILAGAASYTNVYSAEGGDAKPAVAADAGDKHACKGLNACKGKGGCGETKGKNECKGKGECATVKHACKGHNDCKGQGGCGETKGKNECKGKGGCKAGH